MPRVSANDGATKIFSVSTFSPGFAA